MALVTLIRYMLYKQVFYFAHENFQWSTTTSHLLDVERRIGCMPINIHWSNMLSSFLDFGIHLELHK